MAWTLDHTDASNVYWRRSDDGFVVGFNRKGVGEPWSDETAPPADIDVYAPPIDPVGQAATLDGLMAEIDALKQRLAPVEVDVADLKRGGRP
jgi:hypothetical protein